MTNAIETVTSETAAERSTTGAQVLHIVDGTELGVVGPICARTSGQLRHELTGAIAGGDGDLVLHLVEAEVWDATGLGVIVGAHHRAARCGRRLVVADASPRLCRLIRGTKLVKIMHVDDEVPGYVPLAATA